MKKNTALSGVILLLALGMFNVVAFVVPHGYGKSFWVGYAFTTAAFLLQIAFAFTSFGKADSLKKAFFGLPIAYLGLTYLLLQVIWGLVCMFVPGMRVWLAVIVSALLLGFYLILIVAAVAGRETVQQTEQKVAGKVFFIKALLSDIEVLAAKTEDAELKKQIADLVDTVRYSDPMSNEQLYPLEVNIQAKVMELVRAVDLADIPNAKGIIKDLQTLFAERNSKCKLLK